MKKFNLLLAVVVLFSMISIPVHAEENEIGGFDVRSITFYYSEPVVVDYEYDSDKKIYTFGEAVTEYTIPVAECYGDEQSFLYGEEPLSEESPCISNFIPVNSDDLVIDSSEIVYSKYPAKGSYITHIEDKTAVKISNGIGVMGVTELYDDADTANPNFKVNDDGTLVSKAVITAITLEIDALGTELYEDIMKDPQQSNEIVLTMGGSYENIMMAEKLAEKNAEEYVNNKYKIIGTARAVTTKTKMNFSEDSGYTNVSITFDAVADALNSIKYDSQLYLNFFVQEQQPAANVEYAETYVGDDKLYIPGSYDENAVTVDDLDKILIDKEASVNENDITTGNDNIGAPDDDSEPGSDAGTAIPDDTSTDNVENVHSAESESATGIDSDNTVASDEPNKAADTESKSESDAAIGEIISANIVWVVLAGSAALFFIVSIVMVILLFVKKNNCK